jgi:hypothetical protein
VPSNVGEMSVNCLIKSLVTGKIAFELTPDEDGDTLPPPALILASYTVVFATELS